MALAGGLDSVLDRAAQLRDDGNVRLACHLVEYAALAEPESKRAHELRAEIYDARAQHQAPSMTRGIYAFAASSSRAGERDGFATQW